MPIELNDRADAFECELHPQCFITAEHLQALFEQAKLDHPISKEMLDNLEKLDSYLSTRFKLSFGNCIIKQMYDFVPVYVACGGTELGGMDYIIARKVLKKFESMNVNFVRDEITGLIEYIEKLFGAAGMPDSVDYLRQIQNLYWVRRTGQMANTISELYEKYVEQVEGALEEDRYFQYLFEMVQAGENTIDQKNRVLHKVVDETWLKVIEEGIDAIFNIVDKPRRFITTSEEVVPVALAKKITADSVRHLSMNTQFIASDENGDIQPTRVLNVTTEESYDLYENRFIYHLIQRLFAFVDKRTDVIFWSTGDETCNVMTMESKVDDAYEEISYKIEMTIKNRQSYAENDSDNMEIFKRIDRLRRMVRTLRSSAFCEIMSGCAKVHSPIQRTNLM